MNKEKLIILIPGFGEYPETKTFVELNKIFQVNGFKTEIIAWPHYPSNLEKYSMSETLKFLRELLTKRLSENYEISMHTNSMGGILGIILATEFEITRLSMTVTPYQAGTEDDLAGKYKNWKETGFREFTSSMYGTLKIPFSFIEDARKYNALDYITKVNCPKLFIAGKKDSNVPWETSKKLFDSAPEPKYWHLIEDMEHRFQYQEDKLSLVNEIILDFYK